ncbi:DUF1203 domain-containing protein [Streptomyces sp. NPDC006186]|uniref:DUF1203 domain-containing protein n=1 Tax=Streptomyces sp. NPDC006186 TaxID=3155248 RepID=UPI0033A92EFA
MTTDTTTDSSADTTTEATADTTLQVTADTTTEAARGAPALTVRPVPPEVLAALRTADDAGRIPEPFTDDEGGAPLRCCLRRSRPGERIALVSYVPLHRWTAATGARPGPYDEPGPVFVHADACQGPDGDALPFTDAHRVLRRYCADGRILGGELVGPGWGTGELRKAFDDPVVALVHVRAVEYGCFLYEVTRV